MPGSQSAKLSGLPGVHIDERSDSRNRRRLSPETSLDVTFGPTRGLDKRRVDVRLAVNPGHETVQLRDARFTAGTPGMQEHQQRRAQVRRPQATALWPGTRHLTDLAGTVRVH